MRKQEIWVSDDGQKSGTEHEVRKYETAERIRKADRLADLKKSYWYLTTQKYSPNEDGIWAIYGEDSNADMGGHHHSPLLGHYKGTFEAACHKAAAHPRYFTWGYGFYIKKVEFL